VRTPAVDIDTMSLPDRVRLIAELWDSRQAPETLLSAEQRVELGRRSDELDADIVEGKVLGSNWADVRERIKSRRTAK
jgi:putative addiction module component (TIGR02574 family)